MIWGYVIIVAADGLLLLAGMWLLRSQRFGDSPPVMVVLLAIVLGLCLHVGAYSASQAFLVYIGAAGADVSTRMDLFLANMISGIIPAIVFGYILVTSFANSFSMQLNMLDRKPEPISTDAFKAARGYAARGQFVAAFAECRRLAEQFPDSPLPLIETALIQQKADKPQDAADMLRRVLREFPHATESRRRASLLLADLLERCFDDPDTAAYLRNGVRAEKQSEGGAGKAAPAWVELERARHMAERGDIDQAVAAFREVFRRNPDAPRPLLEAATILEKVGRPDDAAGVLRALAHASKAGSETWAEAMYRLARLMDLYFDDPETRLHALQEILRKAPGSKGAAMARQMLRRDEERLNET